MATGDNVLGFINWAACRKCVHDDGNWCALILGGDKEFSEILVIDTDDNTVRCSSFTLNERLVP